MKYETFNKWVDGLKRGRDLEVFGLDLTVQTTATTTTIIMYVENAGR